MSRLLAPSIAGHVEGAYGRAIVTTGAPPPAEPPTSGSPDRAQWIAYHLSVGELAEARELGWEDDEAVAQSAWAAAEAAEAAAEAAAAAAAAAAHHPPPRSPRRRPCAVRRTQGMRPSVPS